MASKIQSIENDGTTIVITIKHGMGDSFSRSVDPTATRAWNKLPYDVRMATRFRTGRYGIERVGDGQCISVIAFSNSHANADALLDGRYERNFS